MLIAHPLFGGYGLLILNPYVGHFRNGLIEPRQLRHSTLCRHRLLHDLRLKLLLCRPRIGQLVFSSILTH